MSGGKPPTLPQRQLREYPPRDDPSGFVEHHYRKFTGFIAGAVCGVDRYKSPKSIWEEWLMTKEEAIAEAERNRTKHVPAIAAGHYWEEANCCMAAMCLYREKFLSGELCIRSAGPVPDALTEDMRATADAFLCDPRGTVLWPPTIIEAKYTTRVFPHRPHVTHLFQLHHQMHVMRVRTIFISYAHGLDATEANDYKDARFLRVRVFRVLFSDQLWMWISERRNLFRQLVAQRVEPTESNGFPRLHENFEAFWVRGEPDESGLLPPEPKWTLACESRSYTPEELKQLPRRLAARPTLSDV